MDLNIHNVLRVRVKGVKHFPGGDDGRPAFASREIVITDSEGKQVFINLFADTEDRLYILDRNGDSMEAPPAPPDCGKCKGTGVGSYPGEGAEVQCSGCNGTGVVQF